MTFKKSLKFTLILLSFFVCNQVSKPLNKLNFITFFKMSYVQVDCVYNMN